MFRLPINIRGVKHSPRWAWATATFIACLVVLPPALGPPVVASVANTALKRAPLLNNSVHGGSYSLKTPPTTPLSFLPPLPRPFES